jgi:formate dehydrogenase major subunit
MKLSRRELLKLIRAAAGGLMLPRSVSVASPATRFPPHKPVGETPTTRCFCGVGCGAIVAAQNGRIANLEGDPDHLVSQGSLCGKGVVLAQLNTVDGKVNPNRLQKVKYRTPGSSAWEE